MNYVAYLKGLKMIGAFSPWRKDDGEPAEALLVAVEQALDECNEWSNQGMSRNDFLSYLKEQDILVFSNIENYINWKKGKGKPSDKPKFTRKISEERRNALKMHAKEMRDKIRPTNSEND